MSQPNYEALILNLLDGLRRLLSNASFVRGEEQVKIINEAQRQLDRVQQTFYDFTRSLGKVDLTDRRYQLAQELIKEYNTKLSQLRNLIRQGKILQALNTALPELEASLNTAMSSLILIASGAPTSVIATVAPQAKMLPATIPATLQLANPVAGQVYAYLSRVGQADTETIARELGLDLDTVVSGINYLISNGYVTTELSPEKKVVARLVRREETE